MVIREKNRLFLLELFQKKLDKNKIDLKELNNNFYGPYRQLRPYNKCECWALEPDKELEWHVTHVNKCLKNVLEVLDFLKEWESLVDKEGKRFNQEKKQASERISQKAREINYKDKFGEYYEPQKYRIINCHNSQDLKIEEKNQIAYLENLANTWQKDSEAEKEKLKKLEEERIKQEQQKAQAEETKKKTQEEGFRQKEQEFKNQFEEERQEPNQKGDEELNDLKNRFHEIYQKEKKYNYHELMTLWNIIDKIEKKTSLDERLQEAKNELKAFDLEEEINQLKNNKTENPQQQAENQKKIAEKEKELKEIEKQSKSSENKQFQVFPQIISKFQSTPNFNTKEKIEVLINPFKGNSDFLLELQTKHQIEDLNALFANKSPEEIIIIIKRFKYDNLSLIDKENKDKKIKVYYQQLNQLAKNGKLTDEQINNYLCKEAIGKLKSERNLITNQDEQKINNTKFILLLLLLPLGTSLGFVLIKKRIKNKNHVSHDVWKAKD